MTTLHTARSTIFTSPSASTTTAHIHSRIFGSRRIRQILELFVLAPASGEQASDDQTNQWNWLAALASAASHKSFPLAISSSSSSSFLASRRIPWPGSSASSLPHLTLHLFFFWSPDVTSSKHGRHRRPVLVSTLWKNM